MDVPRHVERIVVVVQTDPTGSMRRARYAVLSDGQRIKDPGLFGGGCSWALFGGASELEADIERSMRDIRPEQLAFLSATLGEAGIEVDPSALAELPVDVEFETVDRFPPRMTAKEERRMRIYVFLVSVLIGAIWPSWYRRRVPTRANWRRLLRRGMLGWVISNLAKEMHRRQG